MGFYRLLLHFYPASFRAEYGEEMSAIFAQRRRDTALWLLCVQTFFEVLGNAARVHLDILKQDLRYSTRTLARTPGFALTAIIVSALGIGATTAAFTMIDHVLIRPLPFPDSDRLAKLYQSQPVLNGKYNDVAPANYRDWKRLATSFASMGMFRNLSVNMLGAGGPQRLDGAAFSYDLLPTLGVKPLIGRAFSEEDDRESSAGTLLLSYSLWQEEFGGDSGVLGRKVILDDTAYTVIGVMPENFYFPTRQARLWMPMRFGPANYVDRTDTWVFGIARLRRGVSFEQATAEMNLIGAQIARAYPKEMANVGVMVVALRDEISPQSKMMLQVLLGAALCVLLIACTNLANLLLARALVRRKELAVRAAMGAGRERLVRQMLTESLLLAGAGGGLGMLIAIFSLPLLVRLVPVTLPIADTPNVDLGVLLFAAAITAATGVGFGVVPALRSSRAQAGAMQEGSRSGVGGRKERLRAGLVIAEIAGSVVLLVSSGLLIRALWKIQAVDPGFRGDHVLTLRTTLPMPKYENPPPREAFYSRVLSDARALPGVESAAYISFLPMVMRGGLWPVGVAGHPVPIPEREFASLRFVTPDFFAAMRIPILKGRDVRESDSMTAPFVAVVSQSFVKRYWPNEDPIGHHFDFGNADRTVIGVVGDIRVRGLERSSEPQVYLAYKQHREVSNFYAPKDLVIRAAGDPLALAPALRRIIHDADAEQPVSSVRPLSDILSDETASRRVQVLVLAAFAAVAFLLAAIGIHGLLSFTVSNRTQEFGVRIALGATRGDILGLILRDSLLMGVVGVALGAVLAFAAGVELRAILAGLAPGDPSTFAAAIGLSLLMTLAGSAAPGWRAIGIDPVKAIRTE